MLGAVFVVSKAAKFNSDFVVCSLLCITAYCKKHYHYSLHYKIKVNQQQMYLTLLMTFICFLLIFYRKEVDFRDFFFAFDLKV